MRTNIELAEALEYIAEPITLNMPHRTALFAAAELLRHDGRTLDLIAELVESTP